MQGVTVMLLCLIKARSDIATCICNVLSAVHHMAIVKSSLQVAYVYNMYSAHTLLHVLVCVTIIYSTCIYRTG